MRIALAQLNLLIGDFAAARAAIMRAAEQAVQGRADLLVCPELAAFGGYPPRDLVGLRHLIDAQWRGVQELARALPLPALIGCVEPLAPGVWPDAANALVAIQDGAVIASYHKRLLPSYDVFDERRYFRHGDSKSIVEIAGARIGLTICEDIWTPDFSGVRYHADPIGELAGQCDLVVNVSASPYHVDKPQMRRHLITSLAKRLKVPVCYCNQVGGQDELLFDGDSCLIGPDGAMFAAAPRWRESLVIGDTSKPIVVPPFADPVSDLHDALVTGIRDYCAKTKQRSVVLGLSGGIDSAVVAALAVDALGADKVVGLLMPGPYSSPGSVDDALALAKNLGIRQHTVGISDIYSNTLSELKDAFAGQPPGLAEENLQSRLRGVLVMAVANKIGAMALTTGNKSEIATGYCTIYGDMNGGLAPIGDVYKTQVWALARHINRAGTRIPQASIDKPPSAELRENQLDSDSLPQYSVLDPILKQYVEQGLSVDAIIATGVDEALAKKVARLVEMSEFKRRQSAPVLKVTDKAFGVGRRMPLARKV
jgi:NAD+ synthetase